MLKVDFIVLRKGKKEGFLAEIYETDSDCCDEPVDILLRKIKFSGYKRFIVGCYTVEIYPGSKEDELYMIGDKHVINAPIKKLVFSYDKCELKIYGDLPDTIIINDNYVHSLLFENALLFVERF